MNLLLDTHVFLWYILNDDRLPERWRAELRNPANSVYLSVVSVWEACIKYHLGKLQLPEEPSLYLPTERRAHHIEALPLYEECLRHLQALPAIHRDPFDRMLVCQALEFDCQLVTDDQQIRSYPAEFLPV